MSDDIVIRLREAAAWVERQDRPAPAWDDLLAEAADEIERGARLPPIERLQAMELRPGDVIVASLKDDNLDGDVVAAIWRALQEEFPDHDVIVLVGIELFVGRRP